MSAHRLQTGVIQLFKVIGAWGLLVAFQGVTKGEQLLVGRVDSWGIHLGDFTTGLHIVWSTSGS